MRFVAFDLETDRPAPEDDAGWETDPPRITCAATFLNDSAPITWPPSDLAESYESHISGKHCGNLFRYLQSTYKAGYIPVSWNGLGFDFRVLAANVPPELRHEVAALALDSVDPGFQMVCERGFMVGLAAAAEGMGVGGKTEGMDGLKAVEMWASGDREQQERVLEYVAQDAKTTAEVYQAIIDLRGLAWTSKSGRPSFYGPTLLDDQMLTCRQALQLPLPRSSPSFQPWKREKFAGWALALERAPSEATGTEQPELDLDGARAAVASVDEPGLAALVRDLARKRKAFADAQSEEARLHAAMLKTEAGQAWGRARRDKDRAVSAQKLANTALREAALADLEQANATRGVKVAHRWRYDFDPEQVVHALLDYDRHTLVRRGWDQWLALKQGSFKAALTAMREARERLPTKYLKAAGLAIEAEALLRELPATETEELFMQVATDLSAYLEDQNEKQINSGSRGHPAGEPSAIAASQLNARRDTYWHDIRRRNDDQAGRINSDQGTGNRDRRAGTPRARSVAQGNCGQDHAARMPHGAGISFCGSIPG